MKKTLISLVAVLGILPFVLFSCTDKKAGDDHKAVAEKFATALFNKNFDEAKKYATAEAVQTIDMMASMEAMGEVATETEDTTLNAEGTQDVAPAPAPEQAQPEAEKPYVYEFIRDQVAEDGKTATVWFKGPEGDEQQLDLVKNEQEEWKVNFKK